MQAAHIEFEVVVQLWMNVGETQGGGGEQVVQAVALDDE